MHWQLPEHQPDTAPAFHNSFLLLSHTDFPVFYRVCCWDLVMRSPGCPIHARSNAESNRAHPLGTEGLPKPAGVCQRQGPQHPAPGLLQVLIRALCSCQVRRRCSAACQAPPWCLLPLSFVFQSFLPLGSKLRALCLQLQVYYNGLLNHFVLP